MHEQSETVLTGLAQLPPGRRHLPDDEERRLFQCPPEPKQFHNLRGVFGSCLFLLPYMEQTPIYNACNFDFGSYPRNAVNSDLTWTNLTVWNTKIASFLCPSDAEAGGDNINSYQGNCGTGTDAWVASPQSDGIFCQNVTYGHASVTDGTSNTIAATESLVSDNTTARYRWYLAGFNPNLVNDPTLMIDDFRTNLAAIMNIATQCQAMITSLARSPQPRISLAGRRRLLDDQLSLCRPIRNSSPLARAAGIVPRLAVSISVRFKFKAATIREV